MISSPVFWMGPSIPCGATFAACRNAGFLLLLGTPEENKAVERWARQCLNLPLH